MNQKLNKIDNLYDISLELRNIILNCELIQTKINNLIIHAEKDLDVKLINSESHFLNNIVLLDKSGINISKEMLFIEFDYYYDIERLYNKLLLRGEIMEIRNKVYPYNTRNKI